MYDNDLVPGERLDIILGSTVYISRVTGRTPEGNLVITHPEYRGEKIQISRGKLINVIYYKPSGMFSFVANLVVPGKGEEDGNLSELEIKSLISKYQRRDFVRFECVRPMHMRIIRGETGGGEEPKDSGDGVSQCQLLDISGGGIRFSSDLNLPRGTRLECGIELRGDEWINIEGSVVRIDEMASPSFKYKISVQYTDIDEILRRRIIKFIFEEQIKLRKKQAD